MKRKVLLSITKSNWGGAQRYVYDLATHLPPEDFDVSVAYGGTGSPGDPAGVFEEHLTKAGIRTHHIRAFIRDISFRKEIAAFFELLKLFKSERPDIVHLNSSKAGGLGALAARCARVPTVIFTAHGLPYEEDRSVFMKAFIYVATWITFLLCSKVITISKPNYENARKLLFCKSKITFIHNGISTLSFLSPKEIKERLTPHNAPMIGAIGEYTKNKGFLYLIRAAGILKKEKVQFFLCIIGEGEERAYLEKEIKENDLESCTVLTGFIPDAFQYLPAFSVFVLPSLKEGLPYVLLEAGQAKLPIIASDTGGVRDIITSNSLGLLFQSKDEQELATHLTHLLQHTSTARRMGEKLHAHVIENFSLDAMVMRTTALYRAVSYPPKNSL